MNKSKISIIFGALMLGVFSCADPDLAPVLTFDIAGKGAYVRLIEQSDKLINLFNIAGSKYTYSVEFVDLEKGGLVSEYKLDLTYKDNDPENGNKSTGPLLLRSFKAADFENLPSGFKGLTNITITADDVIKAAGLANADVSAGDQFIVNGSLILKDGSVFSGANSSAAVRGSAFQGHFDFILPAACPSSLEGTYNYDGSNYWCGKPASSGSVTVRALGGGRYTFNDWSLGAYQACYGGSAASWGTLAFTDVCNKVAFTGRTDNYGDTWTFTASVSGTEWTIEWVNTYGEAGKGVVKNPAGWPFTMK